MSSTAGASCRSSADTSPEDAPVLTGKHYQLVPFNESLATDRYLGWLTDPEVTRFMGVRHQPQTRETALAFVRSFQGATNKFMWAIFPIGGADPVGTSTLYNINRNHGSVELGLMVGDKAHWGRGASEETIRLLIAFAFGPLGLRRMTGGSYACNHGMNFTYKKLGFTREGRLRSALQLSPGEFVDGYLWGLLASDPVVPRAPGS